MDTLDAMRVFTEVAARASFTRAAEHMKLPRSTVTLAVQALETRLRVRLLQRTTRRVSLTPEGRAYLVRCENVLREIDAADSLLGAEQGPPRGTLRIEVPERFATLRIIPALPRFFETYPDLHIDLNASDRFADIVGQGIDCTVRVGALKDSSLTARRLGMMRLGNFVSREYAKRYGIPRSLTELAAHRTVGYVSSNGQRDTDFEWWDGARTRRIQMESQLAVASSQAYLSACLAGLGIIQAPLHDDEAEVKSGALVSILPKHVPPPMPVTILTAPGREMSPQVRVFVEWLTKEMKGRL